MKSVPPMPRPRDAEELSYLLSLILLDYLGASPMSRIDECLGVLRGAQLSLEQRRSALLTERTKPCESDSTLTA